MENDQHEGFTALGLPIGKIERGGEEEGRVVQEEETNEKTIEESSLLPTPVASPPPVLVKEEELKSALPIVGESMPEEKDIVNETQPTSTSNELRSPSASPTASTLVAPPPPSSLPAPSEPSVPHTELLHLRSLLAHASTADEARLLVDSLLSRWGVPYPALPDSEVGEAVEDQRREKEREEQVGRVHGWLLEESDGREEKVGEPLALAEREAVVDEEKKELAPREVEEEEDEEEEFFESASPQVEQGQGQGQDASDQRQEEVVRQPVVVAAV